MSYNYPTNMKSNTFSTMEPAYLRGTNQGRPTNGFPTNQFQPQSHPVSQQYQGTALSGTATKNLNGLFAPKPVVTQTFQPSSGIFIKNQSKIRNVWKHNMEAEMLRIADILEDYRYVSLVNYLFYYFALNKNYIK
jgi:hypothetical protein